MSTFFLSGFYNKLGVYCRLIRLDKPIGILLLLWPTLWAIWIASEGKPSVHVLVVFVLGVFLMRSAGCVINDFADRHVDGKVKRTRDRPLVSGLVSTREALMLFIALSLLAFILVLTLDVKTIIMSFVALVLAVSYPFMKRISYLPQLHLGAAFGWAIPMVFMAETGAVPMVAWLLFIATVLWATAYDTMYAMVDREYDIKIGVKSTAILFGEADKLIIFLIQVMTLGVLLLVGFQLSYGFYYFLGLLLAAILSAYQQYLIRDRNTVYCFKAFLNNNWVGAVVFFGIVVHHWVNSSTII